jgi:hypothetical protein
MNPNTVRLSADEVASRKRLGALAGIAALTCSVALALVVLPSTAGAAEAPVGLGTAATYAVLGGQTVTNTGNSVIDGDVGVSPGTAVTGFPPGVVNNGSIHQADANAASAQAAAGTAFLDSASRATSANVTADLGGQTLVAGVYDGTTLGLTGTLTLSGNADAVFIFRSASTLITAPGSGVTFIGGAQACNVFWQVGSSATLDTSTAFAGTILAHVSISANHGATVVGRLLASTGAVTLDDNVITRPFCTTPTPTDTVTSTPATGTGTATTSATVTGTATGPGTGTGTGTGTAPGGPGGSATPRASTPAGSITASTRGVAVPRATTPSTAGSTTAVGLTSQQISLAQTGLPLVLMRLLAVGVLLAIVGAGLMLGGGQVKAKYAARH